MKILSLTAENVKRLKAVHITPDGNVVVVGGRNAQGKTSVLDAIWLALGGGAASKGTAKPIRDGEDSAFVTLDLGDLVVTRTWTSTADGKSTLKVSSGDGARFNSPQSMLDALVGRLSFDPLGFTQQDDKTQRATLLSLVDLPFDPKELDDRRRGIFEDRTEANRGHKELKARLAAMPEPEAGLPAEELDVAELLDKAQKARQFQQRAGRIRDDLAAADGEVERARAALAKAEANRDEIAAAEAAIPTTLPDPSAFDERIRTLGATNNAIRQAKDRQRVADHVQKLAELSEGLTAQLEEIDAQREKGLAEATMPLPGLGFDETGVTYLGVPLKQASAAEQLRVSVAMAMALNPKVRVLRITDGSLLDADSMSQIAAMAEEQDYQLWIERVGDADGIGVVIEDGEVRTAQVAS